MNEESETRKWILKQGEYRRLYSKLLQTHRGTLQATTDGDSTNESNGPFAEESMILSNIFRTEALYIAFGLGSAAVTLASLRFVQSKHAISTVFGSSKAAAMKQAEFDGKKMGTDTFQRTFGMLKPEQN